MAKKYRFVSVRLSPGGKKYDYLCGIPAEPGDRVMVETYEGEKIVTVEAVAEKTEAQLELPLQRYKAVVRGFDHGTNPPAGRLEEFRDALVMFHGAAAGADTDAMRDDLHTLCERFGFDFDEVIDTAFKRRALMARYEASGIDDPFLSIMCGGDDEEIDRKYYELYKIR